jgi:hypothetical protein
MIPYREQSQWSAEIVQHHNRHPPEEREIHPFPQQAKKTAATDGVAGANVPPSVIVFGLRWLCNNHGFMRRGTDICCIDCYRCLSNE